MRQIIVYVFLVLTLFCSLAMSETTMDWFKKANALLDSGIYADPQKAIEYLNKGIKLKPDYAEAYFNRGIAYSQIGQYKRAVEDYNKAIRLKPDFADAYYNRGIIYGRNLGQHNRAIEDFSFVIFLKPNFAKAYKNRGIAYLYLDNQDLGCRDAQKACALEYCNLLKESKARGICR